MELKVIGYIASHFLKEETTSLNSIEECVYWKIKQKNNCQQITKLSSPHPAPYQQ